ncbi:MAG: glycosyltransferase [Lachnospiraceae bacterium]|nr:glycosyltransferase [Lachnospiraceae bacterium]
MARVSVIIPVYEAAAHLEIAMNSAISQTYENLEFICVYQSSKDSSLDILERYQGRDSRIQIVHSKETGLSIARNVGVRKSTGKYLFFMDADDAFYDDKSVEQMVKLAEVNDVDMVVANVLGREVKKELIYKFDYPGIWNGQKLLAEQMKNNEYMTGGVWALFLRRDFLEKGNIEYYPGLYGEDVPYIMECFLKAQRVLCTERIFYRYYHWNDSLTAKKIGKWQIESFIKIYYELLGMERRIKLTEEGRIGLEETIIFVYNKLVAMARKVPNDIYEGKTVEERLLWRRVTSNYHNLVADKRLKKVLQEHEEKKIYLYGAGHYAIEAIDILNKYDVSIEGVIVTNPDANRKSLYGNRIIGLDNVLTKECLIIIAMKGDFAREVVNRLADRGFNDICELYD